MEIRRTSPYAVGHGEHPTFLAIAGAAAAVLARRSPAAPRSRRRRRRTGPPGVARQGEPAPPTPPGKLPSPPTTRRTSRGSPTTSPTTARASSRPSPTRWPSKLGYAKSDVDLDPGAVQQRHRARPEDFDFDINQFSITEERKKAVDFSAPYYDVRQAVIALKSSKIAGRTSRSRTCGTPSSAPRSAPRAYQAINDVIKPSGKPQVYNNNDDAKKALKNGQLDGIVVDLPTAFYITGAELTDATIVGQLPQVGTPEQFGLRAGQGLAADRLRQPAVDALRKDGTLGGWRRSGWPRRRRSGADSDRRTADGTAERPSSRLGRDRQRRAVRPAEARHRRLATTAGAGPCDRRALHRGHRARHSAGRRGHRRARLAAGPGVVLHPAVAREALPEVLAGCGSTSGCCWSAAPPARCCSAC